MGIFVRGLRNCLSGSLYHLFLFFVSYSVQFLETFLGWESENTKTLAVLCHSHKQTQVGAFSLIFSPPKIKGLDQLIARGPAGAMIIGVTTAPKQVDTHWQGCWGPHVALRKESGLNGNGVVTMEERRNNSEQQVVEGQASNRCERGSKIMDE